MAVEADVVVAADGVRSRMARWLGAETLQSSPSRTGAFYTYVAGVPLETATPAYEFHVAQDAFAGIFPTHHGRACVWYLAPTRALAALSSAGAGRAEALLSAITAASPSLGDRVRAGQVEAPVRGASTCPTSCVARSAARVPAGRSSATPATTATRSPGTASPTPSATPSCSPTRSTSRCATRRCADEALAGLPDPP